MCVCIHCKLRTELQVVGTFGNSFAPSGKILGVSLYFMLNTLVIPSSIPQLYLSGISPICPLYFHPTPQGWTLIIFSLVCCNGFLTLSPSLVLPLLFYSPICCYNISEIEIKSHHSPVKILSWFSSASYIKSDVLVGHLRPVTVWPTFMFSVHSLQLNHDGRHFPFFLTEL